MYPQKMLGEKNNFNLCQLDPAVVRLSKKKSIPRILIKFTEMVDPELKTQHMKFYTPTSKGAEAMGSRSSQFLKNVAQVKILFLIKIF